METVNLYFSDIFHIEPEVIEEYGAVNISLINDLPLFIDPFLLFNSDDEYYQKLHQNIIDYVLFLQDKASQNPALDIGTMRAWYLFSEVKQTWLGFSVSGNDGRGLGEDFARNLHRGLNSIFKGFGKETISESSHLEKLCLISPFIGRDKISDFTTNLIKEYLLEYTQKFARQFLQPDQVKEVIVQRVAFNYSTMTWRTKKYILPYFNGDYIILTPADILTRDETFINREDMFGSLYRIAPSVDDPTIRAELDSYFRAILNNKHKMKKAEKEKAAFDLITRNPEIIDYYIKYKENNGDEAESINASSVFEIHQLFNIQLAELVKKLSSNTPFYTESTDTYDEALRRVQYLKHVIENQDGYRLFYFKNEPIQRESDLYVMYRLVWCATSMDVNSEVNNGRGPVDYKISFGAKNSTLVEFKLASNSQLKRNLQNQVEIYKAANQTKKSIKVILYFSETEYLKVRSILNELNLDNEKSIILIDARNDNKPSASIA